MIVKAFFELQSFRWSFLQEKWKQSQTTNNNLDKSFSSSRVWKSFFSLVFEKSFSSFSVWKKLFKKMSALKSRKLCDCSHNNVSSLTSPPLKVASSSSYSQLILLLNFGMNQRTIMMSPSTSCRLIYFTNFFCSSSFINIINQKQNVATSCNVNLSWNPFFLPPSQVWKWKWFKAFVLEL